MLAELADLADLREEREVLREERELVREEREVLREEREHVREEREVLREERELLRGYDGRAQELGMTRADIAGLMDDPDVRDAMEKAAKKRRGEATTSRPA